MENRRLARSPSRPPFYLASRSPRRIELLGGIGIRPRLLVPPHEVEEAIPRGLPVRLRARAAARAKALWGAARIRRGIVLAADTVVLIDGRALGKPRDRAEARRMLRMLSGRLHEVTTAVAVADARTGRTVEGEETTRVRFAPLAPGTIRGYAATGECDDKAGAYAVQEIGALLVEAIEGSWTNVVGLPLRTVARLLAEIGAGELLPVPLPSTAPRSRPSRAPGRSRAGSRLRRRRP